MTRSVARCAIEMFMEALAEEKCENHVMNMAMLKLFFVIGGAQRPFDSFTARLFDCLVFGY